MRHYKTGRKLGRNSAHRKAMYRNMVTSLYQHERITTTLAKAKELRRYADKNITIAKRIAEILEKDKESRTRDEQAKLAHAMQMVGRQVQDREILHKVFEDLALRFKDRPGGYTRILKTGRRVGDNAEMAIIELTELPREGAEASAEA